MWLQDSRASHATRLPGVQDGLGAKASRGPWVVLETLGWAGEMWEGDWCWIVVAVESGSHAVSCSSVFVLTRLVQQREKRIGK
jgi:hypothetical protein